MKYLIFAGIALFGLPQLTWACACVSAAKPKPPSAAEVRSVMEDYFKHNQSVLRLRVTKAISQDGESRFEFIVIKSWKGSSRVGDLLVAPSTEVTSCDLTVRLGDELLVGFNSIADANFTGSACPEKFPKARRRLEDRYLRKLSLRYKDARAQ